MKTVLVVDDCFEILDAVSLILDEEGYNVVCTMEPQRAQQLCEEINFDLVLCDLYMRPSDEDQSVMLAGMDLIWTLSDRFPQVPVIAMSGAIEEDNLHSMEKVGVAGILKKPFRKDHLLQQVNAALNH